MASEQNVRVCRQLRSKGMYIQVEPGPDPHVPSMEDGYCWCSHTLNCLGPDGKVVHKDECRPGRDCYQE